MKTSHKLTVVREKKEKTTQNNAENQPRLSKEAAERLIHEASVYQVELQSQNEELRRTQNDLELSRRRYAELYEFAPAGYFTFDKNGIILDVNRTGAVMLGSAKQLLIKRPFSLFISDHSERQRYRDFLKDIFLSEAGKAIDITLRKTDGSLFYAGLQFVFAREPAADTECCRAAVIDISERKELEDALRLREEHYRLLFDSSPLPKFVIDMVTFAFLEVNNAAVEHYGYSRDEFSRLTLADIRTIEEFAEFERIAKECCSEGKKFEGRLQTKHRKKNNEIIDADVRFAEIVYNRRRALLAVVVDITDRKRAEQERERLIPELQRSNKELQQFAYIASHDLQEPLRTISSYVDLLAMKYKGKLDQNADKYISFAVEGANRMSELINDLLAFSRVATQAGSFNRVQVGEVLERALGNLRRTIKESGAAITMDAMPEAKGDYSQFVQLFQNLVGNAVKFRKRDMQLRIHISAERKGSEWVFGVHDNGIGIEPRFSERIFVIFQRLHTREEYPGTGVGLSICRRIVERHGGRIWVESKPGEGSSFYFTLPANT